MRADYACRRTPNFTRISSRTHGESRDTINLTIQARAEHRRRSVDILATFTYDPKPEGYDDHAYGFRLVSARTTTRYRKLGHLEPADPAVTEHTDLHQLLDALITHLHGSQN